MNSIMAIEPYWDGSTWVFDDETVGLRKEPFVAGTDEMITLAVEEYKIRQAKKGFQMLFSADHFPGAKLMLSWVGPGRAGNWYYSRDLEQCGWLCPALFKYFPDPPEEIWVDLKEKR